MIPGIAMQCVIEAPFRQARMTKSVEAFVVLFVVLLEVYG
jgi:hypothetical protein